MEPKRWLYWNGTGQINYRECQLIIRKQTRPICRRTFPQEGSFHLFEMCPTYTNHLKICLYFTGPQMHFRFLIIGLTTHPSGSNFVCCVLGAHNSGCSWNTRHAWYNISAEDTSRTEVSLKALNVFIRFFFTTVNKSYSILFDLSSRHKSQT